MAYTPPTSPSVDFSSASGGYTPPTSPAVDFSGGSVGTIEVILDTPMPMSYLSTVSEAQASPVNWAGYLEEGLAHPISWRGWIDFAQSLGFDILPSVAGLAGQPVDFHQQISKSLGQPINYSATITPDVVAPVSWAGQIDLGIEQPFDYSLLTRGLSDQAHPIDWLLWQAIFAEDNQIQVFQDPRPRRWSATAKLRTWYDTPRPRGWYESEKD